MKPILLIYATREGQTLRIAEHLGANLAALQFPFELVDASHMPADFSLTRYSAAIVCASLHIGSHEPEMTKFVRQRRLELERMPTVFLSVSLSAASVEDPSAPQKVRDEARDGVERTIQKFLKETGWRPTSVHSIAGALKYSRYNFVTRFVMRQIARSVGQPTDTSRDYEYTDWAAVDRVADEVIERISPEGARAAGQLR